MLRVYFENENKINIMLKCQLTTSIERELNMSRNKDESIKKTFDKLEASYSKQLSKLREKNTIVENFPITPTSLVDLNGDLVPHDTKNENAWIENYTLKFNNQNYKVLVNLPVIKKIELPKLLIAGFSATVQTLNESNSNSEIINKNSKYFWYSREATNIDAKWNLINVADNGSNSKWCILTNDCFDCFIKVICFPNDGLRDGLPIECVSANTVKEHIPSDKLPMSERHLHTSSYLEFKNIRVMSYNILKRSATCYEFRDDYPLCPPEYLDFSYRRLLLLHEIKNYKSDVIFLQECDFDFYEIDLKLNMDDEYCLQFKAKSESSRCGECILFRHRIFKFIKSGDILIADELKNNQIFSKLLANLSSNKSLKELILSRDTTLQVVQVELADDPGHHVLLANTHLYYKSSVHFLQAIACINYLERLKKILADNKNINRVSILFGGDFNSEKTSDLFKYISSQPILFDQLNEEEKVFLNGCYNDLIKHTLNLSAYTGYPFTYFQQSPFTIDYIFYERNSFEIKKVVPFNEDKYKHNSSIPSQYVPSDHVAILLELHVKQK